MPYKTNPRVRQFFSHVSPDQPLNVAQNFRSNSMIWNWCQFAGQMAPEMAHCCCANVLPALDSHRYQSLDRLNRLIRFLEMVAFYLCRIHRRRPIWTMFSGMFAQEDIDRECIVAHGFGYRVCVYLFVCRHYVFYVQFLCLMNHQSISLCFTCCFF